MSRRMTTLIAVLLLLGTSLVFVADQSSAEDNPEFLLDYGNGKTEWMNVTPSSTIGETVQTTLVADNHTCTVSTEIVIDGIGNCTIGGADTGASLSTPGTTGNYSTSSWHIFKWNNSWETADPSEVYSSQILAAGYYPDGMVPVETPQYKSSWTMIEKDSENSANQHSVMPSGDANVVWKYEPQRPGSATGLYGAMLYVQGYSFVKYGYADADNMVYIVCYDTTTGEERWTFKCASSSYETTTPVIAGNNIYVQSSKGYIFTFDWKTGPGTDNANVKSFNGEPWDTDTRIPGKTVDVIGLAYGTGPTSMVFDSGCLFTKSSNGMLYCFDKDLNLLWSLQTGGNTYFSAPTVFENYVAAGYYDGNLYVANKLTGKLIDTKTVYRTEYKGKETGAVNVPMFFKTDSGYRIIVSFSDGRGMSAQVYGMAIYNFDGHTLTEVEKYSDTFGPTSTYLTKYGDLAYFTGNDGIYTINPEGHYTLHGTSISGANVTHAALTLVNGQYFVVSAYQANTGKIYLLDLEGNLLGEHQVPVTQYCMSPPVIVEGYLLCGNDGGAYCISGAFKEIVVPTDNSELSNLEIAVLSLAILVAALAVFWCILRFGLKWEKPFADLVKAVKTFLYGEQHTHNKRSKHKLWVVLIFGALATLALCVLSLCLGSDTTLSIKEAISCTISSMQKGGKGLTYNEMLIYNSRLPRTIAAVAVGIGLSIAGAVYQAVIKNPLVEPYIMGVSSGAGTMAVAIIACNFTLFGLLSPQNPYLTAICAIVGGLLAFGLTMILAEKTGGKSTNYVLAGIVIGLVFSAIQSLLMIRAGNNMASALSWLYGSFTSITWQKVWLVLIPVLSLSLVPLVWAKELNLVLLGEDQAKQMGLDAEKFDRYMLIMASVLTSFCVAFCGIIGFIGLVIPHLSRMILGGDHRLMLPTAMAFGGTVMVASDLLARILVPGMELPVGAITTVIGVPVFAYLLVKRGKSYDS